MIGFGTVVDGHGKRRAALSWTEGGRSLYQRRSVGFYINLLNATTIPLEMSFKYHRLGYKGATSIHVAQLGLLDNLVFRDGLGDNELLFISWMYA